MQKSSHLLCSCVNLCVVGRQIFAIGGIMDGGYTSTVERYDPDSDLWMEVDPMTQGRCNPGVAVAGGKIYVSCKLFTLQK